MKGHAIICFNHGVLGLAENPALGSGFWSQNASGYALGVLTPKARPSGWVFNQAQHPMIKTYNKVPCFDSIIYPPKCYWPKKSQNGNIPNTIGTCSYCVLDRLVFEWSQILLHPELILWWSFPFADGAYFKKPHSPAPSNPNWRTIWQDFLL